MIYQTGLGLNVCLPMVQQMFFATKSTDCRWRRCQVNPCFLWVYGLFRTAGFLNVFAFWCAEGKGLFSGRALQGGEHELPVFFNARDVAAFVGRVWRCLLYTSDAADE